MLLSAAAAFCAPFHLFLFAYAVLGPLHYLTEISWLHDRDYFAPGQGRRWWLLLVAATMAVLSYGFVESDLLRRPVPPAFEIGMVYLVFVTAMMLLFVRRSASAAALIVVAVTAIALFSGAPAYALIAYFLVTIVHVLLFTAAFVLHGALRTKSRSGLLSLAVFTICIASFFFYAPPSIVAPPSLRPIYAPFEPLNAQLIALFHLGGSSIYETPQAVAVMRLIAFAYTYHYLNWFSKTSIIRWHEVPRRRAALIAALWIAAMAIYARDYATGFAVLYLLSVLHVLLEFPLDHRTFAGIAHELRALA